MNRYVIVFTIVTVLYLPPSLIAVRISFLGWIVTAIDGRFGSLLMLFD